MKRNIVIIVILVFINSLVVIGDMGQIDCSFLKDIESTRGMVCGFIVVPENHDDVSGKKIKIAYAILKAKSGKESVDPVIFFSGGPGSSSLHGGFLKFFQDIPLRDDRDVILFDQRGINHSAALPDIGFDVFKVMAADADIKAERKMIGKVLNEFREKAESKGVELGDYNSFQNARDVGVLMNELGYGKYNLFGVSYGTRLARLIQDMFPGSVKTVTLDSPNLMTDDFLIDRMKGYSAAAEKIFKFCEDDKDCRSKYPALRSDYKVVIESLKTKPLAIDIDGDVFHLNSQDAIFFLRHRLYRNDAKKVFPAFVEALKNSEKETIKNAIISEKRDVSDGNFNTSMFLAVSVFESMDPANTPQAIDEMYSKLPNFPEQLGYFTNLYIESEIWRSKTLPFNARRFDKSNVPTIIFVNQYDPVTPPENGTLFQKNLTNSWLYIIDEAGHSGGDFGCKMRVMIGFMDDPLSKPDSSCLKIFREGKSAKN